MDVKEADRIVVAKPVASRPTCSRYRSFSELLAGAIDASPPQTNVCSETEAAAIRPKTVRPAINRASHSNTKVEAFGITPSCSSDKVASVGNPSIMVFRPLAKVVSKATASLLASMGHSNTAHQQAPPHLDECTNPANRDKERLVANQTSCNLLQVEQSQSMIDLPRMMHQMPEEENKMTAAYSANIDRLSSDGYNWRKYGQKQVKGSVCPRSYYKCTQANCPVKKKVERSIDGEIAEIVYKGDHNHPKPNLPKCSISGVHGPGSPIDGTSQDYDRNKPESGVNARKRHDGSEGKLDNQNDERFSENLAGKAALLTDNPVRSAELSGDGVEGIKRLEVDNNDPKIKRRKYGSQNNEAETSDKVLKEPNICVRNNAEPEIMGDGFRWRKYGQKVVRGNPHPRSYYRCTSPKCKVRKHVERALDDPSAFITTYEGKHNHERPIKRTNANSSVVPGMDSQSPTVP